MVVFAFPWWQKMPHVYWPSLYLLFEASAWLFCSLYYWAFVFLLSCESSSEKTLMLGKTEGKRREGQQRMRCLVSITDSMEVNVSKLWEVKDGKPGVLQFMGSQRARHDLVTEQEQEEFMIYSGYKSFVWYRVFWIFSLSSWLAF